MGFIADDPLDVQASIFESEVCHHCEGGGWEVYGIGHGDPHFRPCRTCGNPEDLQSP